MPLPSDYITFPKPALSSRFLIDSHISLLLSGYSYINMACTKNHMNTISGFSSMVGFDIYEGAWGRRPPPSKTMKKF